MNKRQQNNNKLPANSLPTSPKPVLKLVEEHEYSEHIEVLVPNDQTQEQVLNVDIVPETQLAHGTKVDIAILLYRRWWNCFVKFVIYNIMGQKCLLHHI